MTMSHYAYRLLNVFAETLFGGNPLCVFEDATGLDSATMQKLARQFNLSETTFILPATTAAATARVRIFTPQQELPFAGHPMLGTAHVVRDVLETGNRLVLECDAGLYPMRGDGNSWQLEAPAATTRGVDLSAQDMARMVSLEVSDLGSSPLWVSCGLELLIVPLVSSEALNRAAPQHELMKQHALSSDGQVAVYLWAPPAEGLVGARMFFEANGSIIEDPATGSAAAALGGWWQATGQPLPAAIVVDQGSQCGRPSRLYLDISAESIKVAGGIAELGRGFIDLRMHG